MQKKITIMQSTKTAPQKGKASLNGTTKKAKKQPKKKKTYMDLMREFQKKPLLKVLDPKEVYGL